MFRPIPQTTQTLIGLNVIAFALQMMLGGEVFGYLALWPLGPEFAPWQIVTYGFLHGSLMHLLFNMFGLYMFGSDIESVWGQRRYLTYYLVCIVTAAIAQLAVTWITGAVYPTVGASGAVFGLLLAFGMMFPRRTVMLLIPPIPMPAWLFVTLYGVIELYLGITGSASGVAHFAHLGGMVGGYLLIMYWRSGRRPRF
ncbi:MAG: rhomboid family intramembrane serine protease [Betaproteobacteria bacterium]|nr:MAG: rhomboid family intramembrane serine protease [Betaproteobacteria bacterium]